MMSEEAKRKSSIQEDEQKILKRKSRDSDINGIPEPNIDYLIDANKPYGFSELSSSEKMKQMIEDSIFKSNRTQSNSSKTVRS